MTSKSYVNSVLRPGPEVIKPFSSLFNCNSFHADVVFILLIHVKMPTIVGILTFMSRIIFMLKFI